MPYLLFCYLAACASGIFCSGSTFSPYNYYRIVEGQISPYMLGFFRMNIAAPSGLVDPYLNSQCYSSDKVII